MAASVLEQFLPACEVRTRLEAIASGTDAELLPLLLEDPARVLAEDLCGAPPRGRYERVEIKDTNE